MTHRTPCCGYRFNPDDPPARAVVMWNPYNGCVQCHHCGQIYVPGDEDAFEIWKAAHEREERER